MPRQGPGKSLAIRRRRRKTAQGDRGGVRAGAAVARSLTTKEAGASRITSDESGKLEVYVRPLQDSSGRWQISSGGGSYPRWRRDGKEVFYIAPDKTLVAVEVRTGSVFETGTPKPLFRTQIRSTDAGSQYDVSADGQRFLINTIVPEERSALTIVQNWTAGLKK